MIIQCKFIIYCWVVSPTNGMVALTYCERNLVKNTSYISPEKNQSKQAYFSFPAPLNSPTSPPSLQSSPFTTTSLPQTSLPHPYSPLFSIISPTSPTVFALINPHSPQFPSHYFPLFLLTSPIFTSLMPPTSLPSLPLTSPDFLLIPSTFRTPLSLFPLTSRPGKKGRLTDGWMDGQNILGNSIYVCSDIPIRNFK